MLERNLPTSQTRSKPDHGAYPERLVLRQDRRGWWDRALGRRKDEGMRSPYYLRREWRGY